LECKEFVNADSIAAGISPFNPESVAIEAGRIMLKRIDELLNERADFALETTLSTRSYVPFIKKAQLSGYVVTLLYFWLNFVGTTSKPVAQKSPELREIIINNDIWQTILEQSHDSSN